MSDSVASARLDAAIEAAERWAIHDPDPTMRSRIDRLIGERSPTLVDLFEGRLGFGTAGLRAEVGPGPNRMNALVVRQTTVGVVRWILEQAGPDDPPSVAIGFDARTDSAEFAAHAAAAAIAAGAQAALVDRAVPTPVLAHAIRDRGASAGVVVTASHNPPADNGYKLYLDDGRQIVDPVDAEIAAMIERVVATWADSGPLVDDVFARMRAGEAIDGLEPIEAAALVARHRRDVLRVVDDLVGPLPSLARAPGFVYTPMHGVGGEPLRELLSAAGADPVHEVASQAAPDGAFPTVAFPNPEEPGALDAAFAVAESAGVDVVLANDPDADRLAMAVRDRSGEFTALSGDELGVLLADHVLRSTAGPRLVARSVVSSRLLDRIAQAADVTCEVTLTGFKWISRAADAHPERRFVFGYEEAIGYAVGEAVRDKDGLTAALLAVHLVHSLEERGETVWDRLDELAGRHGVHASRPVTARFDEAPGEVDAIVERLVADPPGVLGGSPVVSGGAIGAGSLPPTPGVELLTADATRVIVRPSGTEPKVKAYVEVIEPTDGVSVAAARADAEARLSVVCADVARLLLPESS